MGIVSTVVAAVDRIAAVGWRGKLTATESQPAAPVDGIRFEALVELLRALGRPEDRLPHGGSGMYGGWYQPAVEIDYQRATVYTTLFDVQTAKPVWTFDVPTFNPATVRQHMPAYINNVVHMLRSTRPLRP